MENRLAELAFTCVTPSTTVVVDGKGYEVWVSHTQGKTRWNLMDPKTKLTYYAPTLLSAYKCMVRDQISEEKTS